jgi:hypothetical protein
LVILVDTLWLLLGNFNFIRSGKIEINQGDLNDMFLFNETIGHLGLVELPLKGRMYTWSNMQTEPLREHLDWFFTSPSWTTHFLNTIVLPMAKSSFDHVPCMVTIDTVIPKAKISRFENYWVEHPIF